MRLRPVRAAACESTGWLRGLAPFGELHYLTSLQNTDRIQYANVSIYDTAGRVERFNKRYGKTAEQPAASEVVPSS